jgi:hypothetical protein
MIKELNVLIVALCGLTMLAGEASAQDEAAAEGSEAEGVLAAEGEVEADLGGDIEAGLVGSDAESPDDDVSSVGSPALGSDLRFGLDVVLLDVANQSMSNDRAGDTSATDINFGIRNSQLGVLVAYRLNEPMQVGLRAGINVLSGSTTVEPPPPAASFDVSRSGFELGLSPFVEYIFDIPSEQMRLFGLASLGIRTVSNSSEVDGTPGETKVSGNVFLVGLGGGLHYFLSDDISLDPTLEVTFGTGSQTEEVAGGAELESDLTGFALALRIGLSGWL